MEDLVQKFLYYPEPIPAGMPPPPWASDAEEVWMEAEDGVRLHGLWWPEPLNRPVLLFLHGNAQEVYSWSLMRQELSSCDCRLLMIDYRGYGKSEGMPGEQGLYRDGSAALGWLDESGVGLDETVIFGKSLGGAVACEIAQGLGIKGLVLESTFTSLRSVASKLFPFAAELMPPADMYDSLGKLPAITCPVMVIHGGIDALIPTSEGYALFEEAGEPKELYIVEGAGHNDVSITAGEEYGRRIRGWLDTL